MKYELRPYQQKAVDSGCEHFMSGDPKYYPLIVAPTGSGKSLVIARIAQILKDCVLVIQPSKELLEQNYDKYTGYGCEASLYSASVNSKEVGSVTFATIGSIKAKAELFSHIKYILIDECHLLPPNSGSMFMSFISSLQNPVKVIGLTATPFRLKTYRDPFSGMPMSKINLLPRERPRFFNEFIHITQIKELSEQGFLAKIKYIKLSWDNGKLTLNTSGAEYSDDSVNWAIKEQLVIERIPELIQRSIAQGMKHRLVFVKSVADAEYLAQIVPDSACVSAQTKKKERDTIIKEFKSGKIKNIFNVGVLTVGFDFPALDTVIIARPTMSLALYMQMIGRGIRPAEGKTHCAVVDMCGNCDRFGAIEDLEYKRDYKGQWVLTNAGKILSGVKLEK